MASGPVNYAAHAQGPWKQASNSHTMPLIVIVGINGCQGTSVANAFLNGSGFRVRGLTSSPECESSNQWRARGVDIREERYTDNKHVQESFEGAAIIFASTSIFKPLGEYQLRLAFEVGMIRYGSPLSVAVEKEKIVGRAIFDAASQMPELKRFVMSTLPVLSAENWYFATGAGQAEHLVQNEHIRYMKTYLPKLWSKTLLVKPSPSMEGYRYRLKLRKNGELSWGTPAPAHTIMYWLNMTNDFGVLVRELTMSLPHKSFSVAADSDKLSGQDVCALITKISGINCTYKKYDPKDYPLAPRDVTADILPTPIGAQLYDHGMFSPATLKSNSKSHVQKTSFEQFLRQVLPRHVKELQGTTNDESLTQARNGVPIPDTHMGVILQEAQKAWNSWEEAVTDKKPGQDRQHSSAAGSRHNVKEGPFMGVSATEAFTDLLESFRS